MTVAPLDAAAAITVSVRTGTSRVHRLWGKLTALTSTSRSFAAAVTAPGVERVADNALDGRAGRAGSAASERAHMPALRIESVGGAAAETAVGTEDQDRAGTGFGYVHVG